ncbi:hypothetical protein SLEP1_g21102 [Rubroshorea leprosula]|uniref:Uncharacterized protein n=1 Tax=Rubroshorea leprosula TaxID=152421 RepID=A0AAV5JAY6_9ROSI|nr:hypothetical protein SLEP1_g21102 [Rubroshorea leprosula]
MEGLKALIPIKEKKRELKARSYNYGVQGSCSRLASWVDKASDVLAVNLWKLCTIEQVEELKALAKVLRL